MLPEKKKKLIITGLALIALIIVIILMYNLGKYMQEKSKINEDTIIDDAYPNNYPYYGFLFDEDGNYQLMGLDSNFEETKLNLRSFYKMDNLYYYNDHLVLYTDAINQVNYNKEDEEYFFFEQNPFYSNDTEVYITEENYIFNDGEKLEYCPKDNCTNVVISDSISDYVTLLNDEVIFYEEDDTIKSYDMKVSEVKTIDTASDIQLLALNDKYVVYFKNMSIYVYDLLDGYATDIGASILNDNTEFTFLALQNDGIIYETKDDLGNNIIKTYYMPLSTTLKNTYNLAKEELNSCYPITDTLLYAELVLDNRIRYVIMDMENQEIIKEFSNPYVVLIGVE